MNSPVISVQDEIIQSWHDRAQAYHALIARWPIFIELVNRLLKFIPNDFHGHALDIAGGSGLLSKRLLENHPTARVTLIEPAENMRALALQHLDNRIEVIDATSDSLDTLSINADAALCSASFHLMNEAMVLPSVAAVLNTGSIFAVNCWGHSFDEAIELNQKEDWMNIIDQSLSEFDQPSMRRPNKTEPLIKNSKELEQIGISCGLDLVKTKIVTTEIETKFSIEFAAMDSNFLSHVKNDLRTHVIQRALDLCQTTDTISTVDLCFEKVS